MAQQKYNVMVKYCFWLTVGLHPYPGVIEIGHGVRVNPKVTPTPTTKTHLVRFGVFVGVGVIVGLTRTRPRVSHGVTTLLVRIQ